MVQFELLGAVAITFRLVIFSGGIPRRGASLAWARGPPPPMVAATPEAASAESVRPCPRLTAAPAAAAAESVLSKLRRSMESSLVAGENFTRGFPARAPTGQSYTACARLGKRRTGLGVRDEMLFRTRLLLRALRRLPCRQELPASV